MNEELTELLNEDYKIKSKDLELIEKAINSKSTNLELNILLKIIEKSHKLIFKSEVLKDLIIKYNARFIKYKDNNYNNILIFAYKINPTKELIKILYECIEKDEYNNRFFYSNPVIFLDNIKTLRAYIYCKGINYIDRFHKTNLLFDSINNSNYTNKIQIIKYLLHNKINVNYLQNNCNIIYYIINHLYFNSNYYIIIEHYIKIIKLLLKYGLNTNLNFDYNYIYKLFKLGSHYPKLYKLIIKTNIFKNRKIIKYIFKRNPTDINISNILKWTSKTHNLIYFKKKQLKSINIISYNLLHNLYNIIYII